jgi:hypothetical protein
MVMVIAARHERLVARDPLADLEPTHQLHVGQQLQCPVDRRQADAMPPASKVCLDLGGCQRAWLLREQVDDGQPGLSLAKPRRAQLAYS